MGTSQHLHHLQVRCWEHLLAHSRASQLPVTGHNSSPSGQVVSLASTLTPEQETEAGRAAWGLHKKERAAYKPADSGSTRCCRKRSGGGPSVQCFPLLSGHFLLRFGNFQA